ncbi:hypothetical protein DOM21_07350 [Bacteriovorax stolpii]|uniref:hypothetical protein n=1 Tax=Bacteriovorax stolpii TaxID=960 RepID=UPI001159345A|nr:hypothetical protein [Bacteriovorax stolpii]QDK41274.1 hypothetical protein DOM21_07350 [Bacteriovorax stolpii]
MGSIARFFKFLKESWQLVLKNFRVYLASYIAFFLVDVLASIPWQAFGFPEQSTPEILFSLLVGISSLVIIVNVILIEKSRYKHREKEQLLYSVPTYLIYSLYSVLIILVGPGAVLLAGSMAGIPQPVMIGLAVLVGLIVAIFVAMVALASVLIDNDSINYFKMSYRMARQDVLLIICFGALSFLVELPSFAFDQIPDWRFVVSFNLLYAFFDAAAMITLTVTSVRIFYYLKHQLNDQSQ